MKKTDRNLSKKVKVGQRIQTRDEYLEDANNFSKTEYKENKKLYRPGIVIDTNKQDELAIVKVTHSKKGKAIKNPENENIHVRPFVYTKDDEGKPLKIKQNRLTKNMKKKSISKAEVNQIKKHALKDISDEEIKQSNKKKFRELKSRK